MDFVLQMSQKLRYPTKGLTLEILISVQYLKTNLFRTIVSCDTC